MLGRIELQRLKTTYKDRNRKSTDKVDLSFSISKVPSIEGEP